MGTKDRTHAWLDIRTVPNLICRRCGRYNLETISEQRRTKARDREAGIDLLFALSWARQNKAVALICSGADLNVGTTKYGDTALHIAANLGLLHAVEVLVEYCDVNRTNNVDVTPLHGAAFGGRDQVVKLLLSNGANRHALTRRGETAKELALMNRRTSTAGLL